MKKIALVLFFLLKVCSFDYKVQYSFCRYTSNFQSDDEDELCKIKLYYWNQAKLPIWEKLLWGDIILEINPRGEVKWTWGISKSFAEKAVSIWVEMKFDSSYDMHFFVNHDLSMLGFRFASKNGGQSYIYILDPGDGKLFTEEEFFLSLRG